MGERSCSVPLVVRLRGVPDDRRLAELSETIARTVARRLSEAARAITAREGWNSHRTTHTPPVVRFSGGLLDAGLRSRVAAAIEVGIARAVSNEPAAVTGSAARPRQQAAAATPPPLEPQKAENGRYLNGTFGLQRTDSDPQGSRIRFQPQLPVNGDEGPRVRVTALHNPNVSVQLQPDAGPQPTRPASGIDIPAPREDRQLGLDAPPPGMTSPPAPIPERGEPSSSRPEWEQSGGAPPPAPPEFPTHLPPLHSPGSGSETIGGASPQHPRDEATEVRATHRDVLNDKPERPDPAGHGLRDEPDNISRSQDAPGGGAPDDRSGLIGTPEGGRSVDGRFDAFTADGAFDEEQIQVERVVVLETKTLLTEEEFVAGVERARGPRGIILPYKKGRADGSDASPIHVSRLAGGRVRVRLRPDIFVTPYASDRDLRLPPAIGRGVELNVTDVVGVKFLDEGTVSFFPALLLMHLESDATRMALAKAGEAFAVDRAMEADTAVAAGANTIATDRPVDAADAPGLTWAARVGLGLDLASGRIQQYRSWIIETWPAEGRALVNATEQLAAYAQIRGLVDRDPGLIHFANGLRTSYQEWRATAHSRLSEDESKGIEQIGAATEQLLHALGDSQQVALPGPSGDSRR